MPLWLFPAVYAVAIIVTLTAGIWLLLHLTAFARTFAGNADIVPSPKRNRASRRTVRFVLAAFAAGVVVTLTLQILAMTGAANALIH
jgi:hypothetical protein